MENDINGEDYTLVQLRDWLRRLNLPTSGNKAALILRLNEVPTEDRGICPPGNELDEEDLLDDANDAVAIVSLKREVELLRRELALTRRENAVSVVENDLLNRQIGHRTSSTLSTKDDKNVDFATIRDLLPDFDGVSSVELWATQFKSLSENFNLNEETKKALLIWKLKGDVKIWFYSKVDCLSLNVSEVLKEMCDFYKNQGSKLLRRRKFESRKWNQGENFAQYYNEKVKLSTGLNMDDSELIDYIIEGIDSYHLRTQAILQQFARPDALLRAFLKIELPKREVNKPKISAQPKSDVRCYNCNAKGHFANECQKPKRVPGSCYGCGSKEHMMSSCPLRKGVNMVEDVSPINNLKIYFSTNIYMWLSCLIDSGSPISFIQKRYVPDQVEILKCDGNEFFFGLNKSRLQIIGQIFCFIMMNQRKCSFRLIVVKNESMGYGAVLGRDFMKICNIKLICYDEDKYCEKKDLNYGINSVTEESILLQEGETLETEKIEEENNCSCSKNKQQLCKAKTNEDYNRKNFEELSSDEEFAKHFLQNFVLTVENTTKSDFNVLSSNYEPQNYIKTDKKLCHENFCKLKDILDSHYINAVRPSEPDVKCFMKINLKNEKPFNCTPRRLSYTEKEQLQKLLDEYIEKGYIRCSDSEFASPIVLVKKKTGDLRLCVDFRLLNKNTEKDNFPIPLIDDLLDKLANKTIFTKLDLKNGFFHVFMDPQSIKLTSFVTPLGQFEFLRMPFGLRNAPSVFQRFVNKVFADLIRQNKVIIYLDDIMIATDNIEEHFSILVEVLDRMVKNGLEIRMDKCEFLQSKTKYLGYEISKRGIKADENGLLAVKNFPTPKNVRSVQSFLGLCSYFRRFIQNFSIIAKPLYDLVRKNTKFTFGVKELNTFETLKNKLINSPILAIYDPNDPTELHCDASTLGFGAILLQKKKDQIWHPIFYFSKRTTDIEAKYHGFELETLCIIYALKRFRIYLQGKFFKIFTDCNALTQTLSKREINPRISRWALELANYDFILEHRPGSRMQHVDALSRINEILVTESNSFEDTLIICQNKDPKLQYIRKTLENAESTKYEMRNGIIYRKKQNNDILFYVPENMEAQVLFKYHDELGHMGIEKVTEVISKSYWFPNIKEKVATHIQNCLKCIAFSDKTGKTEGLLHNIQKTNIPFETLHIDHIGPIQNPKNLKRHLLVVVDSGTKFTRLYPAATTKSKEAIKALTEYFRSYSRPRRIISDRGSCFTSVEFEDFMKLNNIQHIKVATGSPQANGQVERVNRSVGPMLAKLSDPQKNIYWDTMLESVEYALNNTTHRTIKEHPSVMLFGIRQRGKVIDTLKENIVDIEQKTKDRQLDEIRSKAKLNEEKLQTYNCNYTNNKRKEPHKYKVDDYVMVKNFDSHIGTTKKLIPKFKGPYKICKILRNDRYLLQDADGFQVTQMPYKGVWSVDNIKPWPFNK